MTLKKDKKIITIHSEYKNKRELDIANQVINVVCEAYGIEIVNRDYNFQIVEGKVKYGTYIVEN